MKLQFNTPTPITQCSFRGIDFLLKRDDLISKDFSGNKARKIEYLKDNFPKDIKCIVSYGSVQSNAMYSLAKFANLAGVGFRYYANHIPTYLKSFPEGNFKRALDLGMHLCEGYESIKIEDNELFINEGVAIKEAYYGIKKLALELIEALDSKVEYQIFLPSGTGTTALFLSKAIKELNANNLEVYTTACVGDSAYLQKQFLKLEKNKELFPTILESKKKYHFGKLYREFYHIWLELHKSCNVEFDLLYDPKGWITLLENIKIFDNLVYIHQGGALGNESMLKRYKYKFGDIYEDINKQ